MPGRIGDRIAVLKQISKFKSNRGLEKGGLLGDEWVISNGLLATWEDIDVDTFTSNKLEKFLDYHRIDRHWWKTGEGQVFITSGQKPTDNKEKMDTQEEVYRNIVEGNTEYILIPRSVLQEKYRLVALEQFQKDKDQMDKDKAIIDKLLSMNESLIAEIKSMKTQVPEMQKA